jgi:hypothetical protein
MSNEATSRSTIREIDTAIAQHRRGQRRRVWSPAVAAQEVKARLETLMRGLVDGSVEPEGEAPQGTETFIDDLLSRADTYRDAALIVLAFAVDAGTGAEAATPPAGRRAVAQFFASLMDELNIRARRDAFQTLAKGSDTLLGRDRESWNLLLSWAEQQDYVGPLDQAMRYMATGIAATARNLPPLPDLDVSRLTFRRVLGIVENLLDVRSAGAHEQFLLAALLHAAAEEHGGRRVETKALTAPDASAGTAADVQVLDGGKIIEAYEVTANAWAAKVPQAAAVLRHYDLPRVHIVARDASPSGEEIKTAVASARLPTGLVGAMVDISVLDVRSECRSLVHRLGRPGRRTALSKLWEHLALRQPNDDLVAAYVDCLRVAGVTAEG